MDVTRLKTDVVVIGGGGAGCRAAIEVAEKGLDCVLVDKGRPGRSGATPCALWSIQAPFGQSFEAISAFTSSRVAAD